MTAIIEVKNLKKSFGDNVVLRDISSDIQNQEVLVVIGPSGSGKSTFLRCLNLLEQPDSGSIWIDGKSIMDPRIRSMRSGWNSGWSSSGFICSRI